MDSKKQSLLRTMTGENYQLARVHYKIHDQAKVLQVFGKLKCVDFEQDRKRWGWFYCQEASKIGLKVAWDKVPEDHVPVVLGSFHFKSEAEGFFNFNSFDRVIKGITFFNKKIPRSVLEVTDIEVVNKLFTEMVTHSTIHAEYFDRSPSPKNKAEVAEERIAMIESATTSNLQRLKLLFSESERGAKKPLDLIERFPCNLYDNGIQFLQLMLRMRETVAMQHHLGKTDYTIWSLFQQMFKSAPPDMQLPTI